MARRRGTSQTWIGRENFELKYAVLKMISLAPTSWNEMDLNMLTVTSNVVWPRFIKGNVIHFVSSHLHRIPFIASECFNGEMP